MDVGGLPFRCRTFDRDPINCNSAHFGHIPCVHSDSQCRRGHSAPVLNRSTPVLTPPVDLSIAASPPLPSPCGFTVDCPRDYSLAEVNASANAWSPPNAAERNTSAFLHRAAQLACQQGGGSASSWCLPVAPQPPATELPLYSQPFFLPSHHTVADLSIVSILHEEMLQGAKYSLLDLGTLRRSNRKSACILSAPWPSLSLWLDPHRRCWCWPVWARIGLS